MTDMTTDGRVGVPLGGTPVGVHVPVPGILGYTVVHPGYHAPPSHPLYTVTTPSPRERERCPATCGTCEPTTAVRGILLTVRAEMSIQCR